MTVRCLALHSGRVDTINVCDLQWFPGGSGYYRGPHWHVRYHGGLRQNLPARFYAVARVQ